VSSNSFNSFFFILCGNVRVFDRQFPLLNGTHRDINDSLPHYHHHHQQQQQQQAKLLMRRCNSASNSPASAPTAETQHAQTSSDHNERRALSCVKKQTPSGAATDADTADASETGRPTSEFCLRTPLLYVHLRITLTWVA